MQLNTALNVHITGSAGRVSNNSVTVWRKITASVTRVAFCVAQPIGGLLVSFGNGSVTELSEEENICASTF